MLSEVFQFHPLFALSHAITSALTRNQQEYVEHVTALTGLADDDKALVTDTADMPELHWAAGCPFALVLMVASGVALHRACKRRGQPDRQRPQADPFPDAHLDAEIHTVVRGQARSGDPEYGGEGDNQAEEAGVASATGCGKR